MRIIRNILYIIILLSISGCSLLNMPYLYGNDSCGEGKTAYVYTNGHSAICLNERSVAYIICARELGIVSENKSRKVNGDLSLPINNLNLKTGINSSDVLKVLYANKGKLAEARANALQTCVDIYRAYQ